MAGDCALIIGEICVDLTLPTSKDDAKMRLGGVVHAARGLWAAGQSYAVGAFCPSYLIDGASDYLLYHGCEEFILLGEITGAPNVIAIADVREVGHQGYEDVLREERRVVSTDSSEDLHGFERVTIFPGSYDLNCLLSRLDGSALVTIDVAYDVDEAELIKTLSGRVDKLVISTSSDLFMKIAADRVEPLIDVARQIRANYLLLKENRGGSRLFDLSMGKVEHIPAQLGETINSVGVGDVLTAIFGSLPGSADDAVWRGMQVATEYSRTTSMDDLRRDVSRSFRLPISTLRSLGGTILPWHARPSLQVYLAAPDFSYKNHAEIESAVKSLEYHNFRVRRPVKENGEVTPGADYNALVRFYYSDVSLLRECNAIFAIPIDRDSGSLVEIGIAISERRPVITYDPREENSNTMVIVGSDLYSSDMDACLNGLFAALSKIYKGASENE